MTSKRSGRRTNIRKRGNTYTYFIHVPDGRGGHRQISKGGFRTQREAEAARVEALSAIQNGTYVKPERVSVEAFLVDEWLPAKRPPVIEQSTWDSYEQKIRLHVVPHVGALPLQQLHPTDLNRLYRQLLETGRQPSYVPQRRYPTELYDQARTLRADGLTYAAIATQLRIEFPDHVEQITRHVVASICRRTTEAEARGPVTPPKGLSPRTVLYVHAILHTAFRDALHWNRIVRNPADAAKVPAETSAKSPERGTWTAEQLDAFLDFVGPSRYLAPWFFLGTSGCRRGESLGLKWRDIDLDSTPATATISRQVVVEHRQMLIKEYPKTKFGHQIELDPPTVAMLRTWRASQNEERLFVGADYANDDWVFCHPDGNPYHPDRFSREFDRKQRQYNRKHPDSPLPRITLHGLRHSWATIALRIGVDIKIVSERFAHSSSTITREIYTHVTPPMKSDAARRVAEEIFGKRQTGTT